MKHFTFDGGESTEDTAIPALSEEFDVLITDSVIIFSWNSKDISEIAHILGKPVLDLNPCG